MFPKVRDFNFIICPLSAKRVYLHFLFFFIVSLFEKTSFLDLNFSQLGSVLYFMRDVSNTRDVIDIKHTSDNFVLYLLSYEGWSKSSFLFLMQRTIRILIKFCDVRIKIKHISSIWMLFEKPLWRHNLWHMTSRDIPISVIVVNCFTRVASAKFEIFFHSKKHSIPLRNAHLKLTAKLPNTI